jgi:Flp pilus assembly protein TadD
MAHFIRGTSAMMKNDLETATLHLELAAESLEMVPAVLNNLAVALATRDDRDLDRALILVDKAIERSPEQPYFFETRGQILLKLEQFQEAISSFEKAMPAEALAVQVHRGLATAYAALGQAELAQGHERIAAAAELAKSGAPVEEKKALDVNFGTRPSAKKDPQTVAPPAQEKTGGETGGETDGDASESEADSDR